MTPTRVDALESVVRVAGLPVATATAYALAALAGAWLAFPSAPVSALWAPNAILLAALLIVPRDRWWAHLLAVLPLHLLVQFPEASFARSLIQYGANVAGAVLGAVAILTLSAPPLRFDRVRPVVVLVLAAGLIVPLATSMLMAGAFVLAGIPVDFGLTVAVRTLTNTFAITTLVPLIVHGARALQSSHRQVPLKQVFEFAVLVLALATVAVFAFAVPARSAPLSIAWVFAPLPLLVWATIRFRVPGACGAVLLVGIISAVGVLRGNGPFDVADPIENALSLVCFHVILSLTFVTCAALLDEWRFATRELAAVLGSVHDQIAVLDGSGTIIEVNESWRRGVSLAHASRFDRIVAPANYADACRRAADAGDRSAAEHLAALESVLAGREMRRHFEFLEPTDLEPAWIEVSVEKLQRPEGGAVVTRTDVSARKRAEQEAQLRQQQLNHLGRAAVLGQLSGAFAHELNQPLTSILGNAEAALKLLEGSTPDLEEVRAILRDIVQDDVRAAQVIDRLRALLERGDLMRRPVDLNTTVQEVLEIAKGELLARQVRVTTRFDTGSPAVMADRVQMQQIVLNLLMNACEAMGGSPVADRTLELATRFLPEDSCVQVSMTDHGCGIPAADLERIFQPFVTSKPTGMGMGLAICRSVAEAHRGRLWAESGPGGTTFHLKVPVGGTLA